MPDLYGQLTPQGVLNGSLQTIVYANNYNDLINKPSINSVELQGNKTAADLGLLTAGDIPVESVNGKQGVVILDGDDIEYEAGTSVNSKITDLEAEIGSGPVVSVNGQQGVVELDGTDINYSLTKTLNQKIDEVAASIPVVSYPVTSVNTKTGDVVLDGDDIAYNSSLSVNQKIDAVEAAIPVVSYPVTSVNSKTGAVVLDDSDIEHSIGVSVNSIINTMVGYIPVYGNTASGAIATFDTSLALPLQDCTIGINTSTGVSGANVYVKGANLWDEEWESGSISSSTGENTTGTGIRAKNYIPVKEDVIYYARLNAEIQTNATNIQVRFYDANKNYIGSDNYWGKTVLWNSNTSERTLRVPVGTRFMRFALQPVYGFTYSDSNRISINYPATDTEYHAYNPNSTTTSISWSDLGTVSEGSLNVTTGKLTVVTGSMGAGDYQITPIPINQLSGTNNVFCDTGDTSVVYACSLKDYIDRQ